MSKTKPPTAIYEQHPAWQAWNAERDELDKQRRSVQEQAVAEGERVQQMWADHEVAVQEAIRAQAQIPERPVVDETRLQDAAGRVRMAEWAHQERRAGVLAEVAESGGIDSARERLRVVATNVRHLVEELEVARKDAVATMGVLADLQRSADVALHGIVPSLRANSTAEAAGSLDLGVFAEAVLLGLPMDVPRQAADGLPQRLGGENVGRRRYDNPATSSPAPMRGTPAPTSGNWIRASG